MGADTFYRSEHFTFKTKPNHTGHLRVGVVLSGGLVKKAVTRNSLKRIIYDAIGRGIGDFSKKEVDLLLILNKAILKVDASIKSSVNQQVAKALAGV